MAPPPSVVPPVLASAVPPPQPSSALAININTPRLTVMAQYPSVVPPVLAFVVPPQPSPAPVINTNTRLMTAMAQPPSVLPSDLTSVVQPQSSSTPAININTLLLASACSGNLKGLGVLLDGKDASGEQELPFDLQATYTSSSITVQPTPEELLKGVTVKGDTALHAVAANGDSNDFLCCANLICSKAEHLLFVQNKRGDTPLHLAARAGNHEMVYRLIDLANEIVVDVSRPTTIAAARVKALLEAQNKLKETALHEAVRIGSREMVELFMDEDPELAGIPEKGTSPLYLAILFKNKIIAETLHVKSGGVLSYSGPNGQNALHAAVCRGSDITKMMLKWNKDLTAQTDENGSTPLHFAADQQPRRGSESVCQELMEANPAALYQSDHRDGFFPIHVAASVRAHSATVAMFVKRQPDTAGLRDDKGRTFLHVAVEKKILQVVNFACRYKPISWILNMRDDNGNTALHLAVQKGSLYTVCSLLVNLQIEINLTNDKGKTPLDISQDKIPTSNYLYNRNSTALIHNILTLVRARRGASRRNPFNNGNNEDRKASEMIKETATSLSIGSVLIATVTFGAIFALPGGYIADDHKNRGTPTRAGRYAFDAFMIANTLSFVCSSMATIGFMFCGSSMFDLLSRKFYLAISAYLMQTSISSLAAAFALGVYTVLSPVAHKTAAAVCVLSSLVALSIQLEFWAKGLLILPALLARNGRIRTTGQVALLIIAQAVFEFWPIIFIFGWAAQTKTHPLPAH